MEENNIIYSKDDQEKRKNIRIDLNNISSYLYKIGYLKDFNKKSSNNKNSKLNNQEIEFESNSRITITDASVKYSEILQTINKTFNSNFTFDEIYTHYSKYTKYNITFCTYLNYLLILYEIITKYNDILNPETYIHLSKEKISLIEIDSITNQRLKISPLMTSLEQLKKNLLNNEKYDHSQSNSSDLIILIFFISMNNSLIIDASIKNLNSLIQKFTKYNKLYVSNINLGLFLYFQLKIFINLCLKTKPNRQSFDTLNNTNSNQTVTNRQIHYMKSPGNKISGVTNKTPQISNRTFANVNKKTPEKLFEITRNNLKRMANDDIQLNRPNIIQLSQNIPNLFLFDNETVKFPQNSSIKVINFQNYLKLYAFYDLNKKYNNLIINLTVSNYYELYKIITQEDSQQKKSNDEDDEYDQNGELITKRKNSDKTKYNYNIEIFEYVNIDSIKNIFFDGQYILSYDIINDSFYNYYFN